MSAEYTLYRVTTIRSFQSIVRGRYIQPSDLPPDLRLPLETCNIFEERNIFFHSSIFAMHFFLKGHVSGQGQVKGQN